MYQDNNSSKDILQRMIDNTSNDIVKDEKSFTHDVLSPTAQELAQGYIILDEILKRVFAKTASENGYSDELRLRCAEHGVYGKAGTYSTTNIACAGADGTVIPINFKVQTIGGLSYLTTESKTISNGTCLVGIRAENYGSKYNVPANTIVNIPVQLSGLTSVTNILPATGGTDDETDEDLLARFNLKVQMPATSGNIYQYKLWALSVEGVGDAQVFDTWNGGGTVKVCVIDSNKQPPSQSILTNVQNYIESVRPVGPTVTYEGATALAINVNANVIRSSTNYTQVQLQDNVKVAIIEYLKTIAFTGSSVSFAKIGSIILSTEGVQDYSNLSINGMTSNIPVASEYVAIMGTVSLNVT